MPTGHVTVARAFPENNFSLSPMTKFTLAGPTFKFISTKLFIIFYLKIIIGHMDYARNYFNKCIYIIILQDSET